MDLPSDVEKTDSGWLFQGKLLPIPAYTCPGYVWKARGEAILEYSPGRSGKLSTEYLLSELRARGFIIN